MQSLTVFLIVLSVACSSSAQVLLKAGMTTPRIQAAIAEGGALGIGLAVTTSPLVVVGLAIFGLSAVLWLAVLSRVPLSSAYPAIALGIVVTVLSGYFMFDEAVGVMKIAGVALIVTGVLMVGLS